jgi:hypothetical protein
MIDKERILGRNCSADPAAQKCQYILNKTSSQFDNIQAGKRFESHYFRRLRCIISIPQRPTNTGISEQ